MSAPAPKSKPNPSAPAPKSKPNPSAPAPKSKPNPSAPAPKSKPNPFLNFKAAPKTGKRILPGEITISSVSGGVNKHILVATLGLVAIGVIKKWNQPNSKLTPVLSGGFVFLLVLSVADLAGGEVSKFASALAMLALVTGLLTEFPWNTILNASPGQTATNPPAKPNPPQ